MSRQQKLLLLKKCAFSLILLALLIVTRCAPVEKRVDLTYGSSVKATGGSGEVLVAQPVMKQNLAVLPSGRQIIGKSGDIDIVIGENPANWLLSALKLELSAAGYDVKTVPTLPAGVSKGINTIFLTLSANQSSKVLTIVTTTDVKLEVQLWTNGRLAKTLTVSAQDYEEGADRSSEPIRLALEKTLNRVMQELLPDIIKGLQ